MMNKCLKKKIQLNDCASLLVVKSHFLSPLQTVTLKGLWGCLGIKDKLLELVIKLGISN